MSPHVRLVLASASPARLRTLRNAGVDPVVMVSLVDEPAAVAEAFPEPAAAAAAEVAALLARAKAEEVAARAGTGGLVLGCDSVLELDGKVLGKPLTPEVATRRWRDMRGQSGVLHTGHWLVDRRADPAGASAPDIEVGPGTNSREVGAVSATRVDFADITDAEIEAYVRSGEPLLVAGGFTVDGLGGAFISGVTGDHHNVVGVSLPLLRRLVRELGLEWTDLWATRGQ